MSYSVHQGYFIFGGVDSRDYGVYITGENAYNAAKRRDSEITIPGRSGTLTIDDNTFDDVDIVYPAFIARDYNANVEGLRNALSALRGKQILMDCYHTDEYMLAKFVDGLEADTAPLAVAGSFDIRFRRDPRRYLLTGTLPVPIAASDSINNPTDFASRPLIRVVGSGTVTVGDVVVTVAANSKSHIDIDAEMMDCYSDADNCNALVSFSGNDFPLLPPGTTGLAFSGLTSVTITPRWWRV